MSRDQNLLGTCQETNLNKETTLFLSKPCDKQGEHLQQWDAGCLPVYFTVTAVKSLTKCSGKLDTNTLNKNRMKITNLKLNICFKNSKLSYVSF